MRSMLVRACLMVWTALLLSGCSSIRLAYDSGPTLAWWWIDGYADFTGDRAARVKDDLRVWFAWHRTTQLPDYAGWLAATRANFSESVTPAQMCRWYDEARQLVDPAIDRGLVMAAAWVPTLGEAQFRHIEQRYAKGLDELRRDYLQADLAARHEAAVKRTVERAEMVYGRLDDAQLKVVHDALRASPFDPQAWLRERQRRQQDTLQTLRRLVAERADADRIVAALRALAERTERSPDPAYRAYQQRLIDDNCAFAARLHNAMTPAQRQAGRERLKGWEDDVRALVAASQP